jgi:hypothetical protein
MFTVYAHAFTWSSLILFKLDEWQGNDKALTHQETLRCILLGLRTPHVPPHPWTRVVTVLLQIVVKTLLYASSYTMFYTMLDS